MKLILFFLDFIFYAKSCNILKTVATIQLEFMLTRFAMELLFPKVFFRTFTFYAVYAEFCRNLTIDCSGNNLI